MRRNFISFDQDRDMFRVRLPSSHGRKHIGFYATMEKAVKARNKAFREAGLKVPD
jgi:hypothetical protein